MGTVLSAEWGRDPTEEGDPLQRTLWIRDTLVKACHASMPLASNGVPVGWPTGGRKRSPTSGAQLYAGGERSPDAGEIPPRGRLPEGYRKDKVSLKVAIRQAKAGAWKELLQTLKEDSWGRPYKMVFNKLRPSAPPLTQSLDPEFVRGVVRALFPEGEKRTTPDFIPGKSADWSDELRVGEEELQQILWWSLKGNTAPSPDGLHKRVIALAFPVLAERLGQVLTDCLRVGAFPKQWRRANLILLQMEGRSAESPSAYRPICLLDELAKLLERVVARRLVHHLSYRGPDLSGTQFKF